VNLTAHAWPLDRLAAALAALAESHGLIGEPGGASFTLTDPVREADSVDAIGAWLEHRASLLGAELEPTHVQLLDLEHDLPRLGPALLLIRTEGEPTRVLALLPGNGSRLRVLGPDQKSHRIDVDALARSLVEARLAARRPECEAVLESAGIPPRRRAAAIEALLRRSFGATPLHGIWQLRLPPSAPLGAQLHRDGAGRSLARAIAAHLAHYLLLLASWFVIGRGILRGHSELGWLVAWALLLLSIVPLRALQSWHTGLTALRVGAVIKRRLLAGALALEPDEIRTRGIGRLLALVIESSAVESLAISTGFASVSAVVDLGMAAWVLGHGAGGPLLAAAMSMWLLIVGVIGWRYAVHRFAWARQRLDMTHALVERMVGHTTRLAQEPPARWHEGEDAATAAYLGSSRAMDRLAAMLRVAATRGWFLIATLGLWPVLVGGAASTTTLAIAFGGVLLAQVAFGRLAGGVVDLVDLMVAWREVRGLSATASRGEGLRSRFFRAKVDDAARHVEPPTQSVTPTQPVSPTQPVIEARELGYRYPGRERPVLRACDLCILAGERVLLEGPSGGGKSTLAALLTGLREPDTGLLLLDGLDRPTHGELGWRARVAAAPQFHQNHVLTNTFAFNLLMGRRWPPEQQDVELADAICKELGLGPLLERMPAGMLQNVGETGWQLSHGERSRLYLARALLQGAELVILDESLAALDPENQGRALACAFERAPTLLVIAHP
jgi:ATP-binding cassette subfamily B protein